MVTVLCATYFLPWWWWWWWWYSRLQNNAVLD